MIDMEGKRYGRLVALRPTNKDTHGNVRWWCRCDCGVEKEFNGSNVRRGLTLSCGCFHKEKMTKHGGCGSSTYNSWHSMLQRCTNDNNPRYEIYGGRGIKVCDKWFDFESFLKDMGQRPNDHTLDRIDTNKGYFKENCKWSNLSDQNYNRRKDKRNVSGRVGVAVKSNGKFVAYITKNYEYKNLGEFDSIEKASEAREFAEIEVYGFVKGADYH